jgi:hypothetical protein
MGKCMPIIFKHVLFRPVVATVLINLMAIYLYLLEDTNLFSALVSVGLKGTWNWLTLDVQANINNTVTTVSLLNGSLFVFFLTVFSNVILSVYFNYYIYQKSKQKGVSSRDPSL